MAILVLDLDGTLLTSDFQVDLLTQETLINLQKQGTTLVLATGRYLFEAFPIARLLQMEAYGGIIIGANGAVAFDLKNQAKLFEKTITPLKSRLILNHLKDFEVDIIINQGNYFYTTSNDAASEIKRQNIVIENQSALDDIKIEIMSLQAIISHLDEPVYKILALGESQYFKTQAQALVGPLSDIAEGSLTLPFEFEFTAFGINKGNCLKEVMRLKKWRKEDLYGFGDGDNDISLLKACHYKIAMGNGSENLKTEADFISKSNDEAGIIAALKHYHLI